MQQHSTVKWTTRWNTIVSHDLHTWFYIIIGEIWWRRYIFICNMYYLIISTILGCILVLELSRTCPPQLYFYMCKSMNLCNTAGTHWTHKSMDKYSNWIKLYSYCLSIIRCITDNDCGLHKMNHCLFNVTFRNISVILSGW